MNPSKLIMGGADNKMAPLISFHTIFDIDVGLVQLIFDEYLEPKVFNKDFFHRPLIDIIRDLYYRKDENILNLFANKDVDQEILDNYYQEFLNTCMDKILDKSITTEIINMISMFNNTSEINPTILYYNEKQKELLDDEPLLKKNRKVCLKELNSEQRKTFSQYYFKYIDELEPFTHCRAKTFYISNHSLNLNDDKNDIKDSDLIIKIIKGRNQISIFNLYNEQIIQRKDN